MAIKESYYPQYSQHHLGDSHLVKMAEHPKFCITWEEEGLVVSQMILAKIDKNTYRLCLIATNPRFRKQGYTRKVVQLAAHFLKGKLLVRSNPLPSVSPYFTNHLSMLYTEYGIQWIVEDDD